MSLSFSVKSLPYLIFGPGSLAKLPEVLLRYGKEILIVTGKSSFTDSAHWASLQEQLNGEGFRCHHASIHGEPTPEDIDSIALKLADVSLDAVVAIGGGSVLDGGKAVSAIMKEKRPVITFLEGVGTASPSGSKLPFIAVPTTSGTGSEATSNSVIRSFSGGGFKKSLRHDNYIPDVALIDPALTLACPPQVTAACGMDAYTQLVEAYLSTNSNPFTDSLAFEGIQAIHSSLPRAVADGNDLEARSSLAYGSYLSGIVLANAGLGTVHGFASVIGGLYDIPHGIVCGTLMAEINRATLAKLSRGDHDSPALKKYTRLGELVGDDRRGDEQRHQKLFIEHLQTLTRELQIPDLGDFGVKENDLEKIAGKTSNKYNPVQFNNKELVQILRNRL